MIWIPIIHILNSKLTQTNDFFVVAEMEWELRHVNTIYRNFYVMNKSFSTHYKIPMNTYIEYADAVMRGAKRWEAKLNRVQVANKIHCTK